jgi:hypothetical protein
MPLLRRPSAAPREQESASAVEPANREGKPGGKGRPTPKRREAQQQRRAPAPVPKSRWQAYQNRRSDVGDERRAMRSALRTGDERNLPPRDAGPARRLVRDIVDSRRNAGGVLLIALLVSLVLGSVKSPAVATGVFLVFVFSILVVVVDMAVLSRRVRRAVRARFSERDVSGVAIYAVLRALQFRRWRLPPVKVQIGQRPD